MLELMIAQIALPILLNWTHWINVSAHLLWNTLLSTAGSTFQMPHKNMLSLLHSMSARLQLSSEFCLVQGSLDWGQPWVATTTLTACCLQPSLETLLVRMHTWRLSKASPWTCVAWNKKRLCKIFTWLQPLVDSTGRASCSRSECIRIAFQCVCIMSVCASQPMQNKRKACTYVFWFDGNGLLLYKLTISMVATLFWQRKRVRRMHYPKGASAPSMHKCMHNLIPRP